jgi:hypothetical protein
MVNPDQTSDARQEARPRSVLAIDSKLRGCDVVAVRVDDVAPSGYSTDRASIRQKKTGRPVRFELTYQARLAIDEYLRLTGRKPGQFLFAGRGDRVGLTTRQYTRLVQEWVASVGLDPAKFGTHRPSPATHLRCGVNCRRLPLIERDIRLGWNAGHVKDWQ